MDIKSLQEIIGDEEFEDDLNDDELLHLKEALEDDDVTRIDDDEEFDFFAKIPSNTSTAKSTSNNTTPSSVATPSDEPKKTAEPVSGNPKITPPVPAAETAKQTTKPTAQPAPIQVPQRIQTTNVTGAPASSYQDSPELLAARNTTVASSLPAPQFMGSSLIDSPVGTQHKHGTPSPSQLHPYESSSLARSNSVRAPKATPKAIPSTKKTVGETTSVPSSGSSLPKKTGISPRKSSLSESVEVGSLGSRNASPRNKRISPSSSMKAEVPKINTSMAEQEVMKYKREIHDREVVRMVEQHDELDIHEAAAPPSPTDVVKISTTSASERRSSGTPSRQLSQDLKELEQEYEQEEEIELTPLELLAKQQDDPHCLIKLDVMKRLNQYLANPKTRQQIGLLKVLKVSSTVTALGTSHGLIVLFSPHQEKLLVLKVVDDNSSMGMNNYNSVTSMDITSSGDFIAAGYSRGQIILWDTKSLQAVKKIVDQFNGPVDNIYFLRDKMQLVASSKMVVKTIVVNKMLFTTYADSKVVMDGFGAVRHLSVLPQSQVAHSTNDFMIVAVATDKEVMIISLRPMIRVIFRVSRPADISTTALPCISWREVFAPIALLTQAAASQGAQSGKKGKNPIFSVGWGNTISFFQLQKLENLELFRVAFMKLDPSKYGDVIGLGWLDERVLVIWDSKFNILIADPFAKEEPVENHNLAFISPVFHSRFDMMDPSFKTVVTPIPAYHNSYFVKSGVFYVLGESEILGIGVITWRSRIEKLLKAGRTDEAIKLSIHFYKGNGEAVVGLPTEASLRTQIAGDYTRQLVLDELQKEVAILKKMEFKSPADKSEAYKQLARRCFNYLLDIERSEIIFNQLYSTFKEEHESAYIQILVEFILNKKLRDVPKQYLMLLMNEPSLQSKLEEILLSVDFSSYQNSKDFNLFIEKCTEQRMYRALIYVYNTAKDDYITPIKVVFGILAQQKKPEETTTIRNMLFSYLEHCFKGHVFPSDTLTENAMVISHQRLTTLKRELLNYIFYEANSSSNKIEERYPTLIRFLLLNSKKFFNVLRDAFEDNSPTSPWQVAAKSAPQQQSESQTLKNLLSDMEGASSSQDVTPAGCITRERMVQILYDLIVDTSIDSFNPWEMRKSWPSLQENVNFFAFLVQFIAQNIIVGSPDLIHRIVATLAEEINFDKSEKNLTQEHIITVLKNYLSQEKTRNQVNRDKLIKISEKANFHRICVYLQTVAGNYDKVLEAYLKDESLKEMIYTYISKVLTENPKESPVHGLIKAATLNHLSDLLVLNGDATAHLIIQHFLEEHTKVLGMLASFPRLEFNYLKNLIAIEHSSDVSLAEIFKKNGLVIDVDLKTRFVALMCQFEPNNVYKYLTAHHDYKLDECLEICKKYKILDATSYLYERAGDILGAINLYLQRLGEKLVPLKAKLIAEAENIDPQNTKFRNLDPFKLIRQVLLRPNKTSLPLINGKLVPQLPEYKDVDNTLSTAIEMCQRNTDNKIIEETEMKDIWFNLLNYFIDPLRELIDGYFNKYAVHTLKVPVTLERQALKIIADDFVAPSPEPAPSTTTSFKETAVKAVKPGTATSASFTAGKTSSSQQNPVRTPVTPEIAPPKPQIIASTTATSISALDKALNEDSDESEDEEEEVKKDIVGQSTRKLVKDIEQSILKKEATLKFMERLLKAEFSETKILNLRKQIGKCSEQIVSLKVILQQVNQLIKKHIEEHERLAQNSASPNNMPKLSNLWFQCSLATYIHEIFGKMVGYLDVPFIIESITVRYRKDALGYFKDILLEFFNKFDYEKSMYVSVKKLLHVDSCSLYLQFVKKKKQGVRPHTKFCFLCRQHLYNQHSQQFNDSDIEITIFNCGHTFHSSCLDSINMYICPVCNSKDMHKQLNSLQAKTTHQASNQQVDNKRKQLLTQKRVNKLEDRLKRDRKQLEFFAIQGMDSENSDELLVMSKHDMHEVYTDDESEEDEEGNETAEQKAKKAAQAKRHQPMLRRKSLGKRVKTPPKTPAFKGGLEEDDFDSLLE